jgi:hypothetical protein
MIDIGLLGPFLLAALLLVVIPGPDMVIIVDLGSRSATTVMFISWARSMIARTTMAARGTRQQATSSRLGWRYICRS